MAIPASYGSLPFQEQIAFFRQKMNLPTAAWTDVLEGQHARAFVVAGAARDDLLTDLRGAIDKAIAKGTTLQEFRKDFDAAVAKTGWTYNGGRNWRSKVIYDTNLRTSYMAGRYEQLQAVKAARPYWRYRHSEAVERPRPEHLAWDGLILSADDPWWSTHYPPNGWGCKCYVEPLGERQMERLGKSGPDAAPPLQVRQAVVGANGPSPRTVNVPAGIDPGWGYNVGEAAYGRSVATSVLQEQSGGRWVELPGKSPADYGRPVRLPSDVPVASMGASARQPDDVVDLLRAAIGGEQAEFRDPTDSSVLVMRAVADHMLLDAKRVDGREQYFPFIREVIEQPYEVWVHFARNELTGKYGLRRRYVKSFRMDKNRVFGLVAESASGIWTAVTFYRGDELMQTARKGVLLWGRK